MYNIYRYTIYSIDNTVPSNDEIDKCVTNVPFDILLSMLLNPFNNWSFADNIECVFENVEFVFEYELLYKFQFRLELLLSEFEFKLFNFDGFLFKSATILIDSE